MLNLLYFAWIKERMDCPGEQLSLPPGIGSVGALALFLQNRDSRGQAAFAQPAVIRAAVNQAFATPETPIADGDEVAFFPPVTGG